MRQVVRQLLYTSLLLLITLRFDCGESKFAQPSKSLKNLPNGWLSFGQKKIGTLLFLRGCLHVKFHPRMKSSLSMVKCLLLFTRFCRDEISSRDERRGWNFIPGWKKEKKKCKHFIPGWNFKMSMLFKFLTYVFKFVFQI